MEVQPYTNSGSNGAYSNAHAKCDAANMTEEEYAAHVKKVLKCDAYIFSGCQDAQTSADVYDLSKGFPKQNPESPNVKSGGACTNAMLSVLAERGPRISFGDLLCSTRSVLKKLKYTQVPQLSTSRQMNLRTSNFTINNPNGGAGGRKRALIIGINYFNSDGELNGCVNDARAWKKYLAEQGWDVEDPDVCRVITDDPTFTTGKMMPTAVNIYAGMQWLVKDAQPSDSLFISMSAHGTQLPEPEETKGEEADGFDEAMVPVDFEDAGFIRDDNFFKTLILPLPENCHIVGIFDMCHSASLCDLSYCLVATDENCEKYQKGELESMKASALFSCKEAEKKMMEIAKGAFNGLQDISRSATFKRFNRCCKLWFK